MEGGTLQKKRCSKRDGIERMFLSSSVEDAKVAALSLFLPWIFYGFMANIFHA